MPPPADGLVIRGGTVYDGSGSPPVTGDVAVEGDRIVAVGQVAGRRAGVELDARDRAIAPGFVNVLSWATESLIADGRALSDVTQGVTLEVMGEGQSMGPLNETMKEELAAEQLIEFDVEWTTLDEYLEHLVRRGVSPNVASFVGATTVREHVLGNEDRPPTADELDRMQNLVRAAMADGALGLASALIYAPAFYAATDELVALARAAGEHDGIYISHLRSEGNGFLEALEELLTIARSAGVRAEIYHLKAAGRENWHKLDAAVARIEQARAEGLRVTADMYPYTAGATGLNGAMPPWVQEGGFDAWRARLSEPGVRARVEEEMTRSSDGWENMFLLAGPENMRLLAFRNAALQALTGRTLAEVARERGASPAQTAMDLVVEDGSRVGTAYFTIAEENVRRELALPWVSFGSDAAAPAAEGLFLQWSTHPRAYGTFARVLGRYVREEGLLPLEEAIRRMTSLPADNLRLVGRGRLAAGCFADIVVFDPERIRDHATFDDPHQYASGVAHVLVNGVPVVLDGDHTEALPGHVVRRG